MTEGKLEVLSKNFPSYVSAKRKAADTMIMENDTKQSENGRIDDVAYSGCSSSAFRVDASAAASARSGKYGWTSKECAK